jgi:hypothetical protein
VDFGQDAILSIPLGGGPASLATAMTLFALLILALFARPAAYFVLLKNFLVLVLVFLVC